jgi:predicted RNase H-like HicB family nuclease
MPARPGGNGYNPRYHEVPMLIEYVEAAMRREKYELLNEKEGFFARIPGFKGVWAKAATLEACRDELQSVLEDWILIRIRAGLSLPVIDRLNLNAGRRKPRKRQVA